ncbi:2-oxoacid:acceptor oxidoreductase subunit alpha [Carboxydochorda subterranea]|uniref:2-oxoacid:acceptor oxidoreductase subunit alpha n=1 Tax=Carboxydichorda subterranea TaxID=3109565 RepID=A0ABZ1BV84_9FIRM|nr:2-oxoacid:acceptor oxidoreductase subunit alpha [Limnochorda sp. L945t]WRP16682.1 2-oxoacid:acceptor oxidoreductase subunit alpha [Limnochorda sp. L945t]
MGTSELTLKLAGEAGQGVESSGAGFARALHRAGLHVFTWSDYMSRIRGGHNAFAIRVSREHPVAAPSDRVQLLLAFDEASIDEHTAEMDPSGAVLLDEPLARAAERAERSGSGARVWLAPFSRLAEEAGGSKVMANTVALGMAAALMGVGLETIEEVIRENFGSKKGGAVADANVKVARAGFEYAQATWGGQFPWKIGPAARNGRKAILINGNQALGLGALAGGCRFIAAYPMTPASSLYEWLTAHADRHGLVSKQAEDEIAAILMAIGASYAGARAMTSTSGGGFSLMVEALGLAGMAEVPVVIVDAQRPGPSTGMPTRTGQGDLLFAIHASQGEFPRIVLAPGSQEECFEVGARAFNLAEKYQCPVIVLTDGFLANSYKTSPEAAFAPTRVVIDRGETLQSEDGAKLDGPYARYKVTPSGISPRALPGLPWSVHLASSDEHTELGHFEDEDPDNRKEQAAKRMRKLESARAEMRPPERYGPDDAELTLVGWGSSRGAIQEAVDVLAAEGVRANALHFVDVWPFAAAAVEAVQRARYLVVVEGNLTGQFARLIRAETGRKADEVITRDDGRPITPGYILTRLEGLKVHAGREAV